MLHLFSSVIILEIQHVFLFGVVTWKCRLNEILATLKNVL